MNKGKTANIREEHFPEYLLDTEEYMKEREEENKTLHDIIEGFRKFAQHVDNK